MLGLGFLILVMDLKFWKLSVRDIFKETLTIRPKLTFYNIGLEFGKAMHAGMIKVCKQVTSQPRETRSVFCEAPLWRNFFWERLKLLERKHKGRGPFGPYQGEIFTSARLHYLFGAANFFREIEGVTSFCWIAPRAYAKANWSSDVEGTVSLSQGDYVAVLDEGPDENFVRVYHPCSRTRCLYEGRDIEGAIGLCSREILAYETPFSLLYRPRARKVYFTFCCWAFNGYGNLLSNKWQ
jgi:hypothetical protein